jgi:hypothetical protein
MAVTALSGVAGVPYRFDTTILTASGTGTINAGDWLAYSGQFVISQFSGAAPGTAYWKASGAGIALESNPMIDWAGRSVLNSGIKYMPEGMFRVSAAFSGQPALGVGAYPVSTGSAVGGVTGLTGVGSTWQTADVVIASGATAGRAAPVATVVGSLNFSNAGTGQLDIVLARLQPDYRG